MSCRLLPCLPRSGTRLTARQRRLTWSCLVVVGLLGCDASASNAAAADRDQYFSEQVHPILAAHCYECHSQPGSVESGLRLDHREGLLRGGDRGPAIVPGDAPGSLLVQAIRHADDDLNMPPDGKLPDEAIAVLASWVQEGAAWPKEFTAAAAHDADAHWAYQRPQLHPSPVLRQARGVRNRVDAFLRARQETAGLSASPEADPGVLIRRLSFDLLGLPPSSRDVQRFAAEPSPQAYAQCVDQWLASPRFGERWASLWLGLARYGEDQAHNNDGKKSLPHAWRYRDWVIGALNRDLPYDRFVQLQLAADRMGPAARTERAALGFLGLGAKYYNRKRLDVMADEWEDRIDTTTRTFLGLTVACARCHDHKFDAISMADYYGLAGVFASTKTATRDELHLVVDDTLQDLPVYARGDVEQPGDVVLRRFLTVLSQGPPRPFQLGSGRLELAEAIADARNPLAARVLVNRVWSACFGAPLVATPSNFGALGTPPTHPRLLDDLTVRFVESGWSIKWLVRELVLSQTYRQQSSIQIADHDRDPANRMLWRMNRRRLSVEEWRDSLLAVSEDLDGSMGGPSQDLKSAANRRRTVYGTVSRATPNSMLRLFDFPDANVHHAQRALTITPLQKLFVMNSPFMNRRATAMAARIRHDVPDHEAIGSMFWTLFGRAPTNEELVLGQTFQRANTDWRRFAHSLLSCNEMLYID